MSNVLKLSLEYTAHILLRTYLCFNSRFPDEPGSAGSTVFFLHLTGTEPLGISGTGCIYGLDVLPVAKALKETQSTDPKQ